MNVEQAQREVRSMYIGGFPGAIVSGLLWATSSAIATWSSPIRAMWFLVLGGMFIFPLTQVVLKIMGRPATLSDENPLKFLAMQIAFTIPLTIPIAGAAALHRLQWFYPAMLVIVGAHYLPFVTLYGMRVYAVLAGIMVASGLAIAMFLPHASIGFGGWTGAAIEIAFGAAGLALSDANARRSAAPA
jgi:hypothetical protein